MTNISISEYISTWQSLPFAAMDDRPWELPGMADKLISEHASQLSEEFIRDGDVVIHKSSTIEENVVLKGQMVIGPNCLIASGSYLRGGVFLEEDVIIGPNCEVKSTFICSGSKVAHLSFVGDSIVGSNVNIEAGAIVANYQNELNDKSIRIAHKNGVIETGVSKFGAIIGDGVKIGANAVIAPGALLTHGEVVGRLQLIDQHPGFHIY